MKRCPKCGAILRDSDVYCPKCGKSVQERRVNMTVIILAVMSAVLIFSVIGIVLSLRSREETPRHTTTMIGESRSSTTTSKSSAATKNIMYDSEYIFFPEASYRLLTYEELSVLKNVTQCRVAYNEIYARKGRIMNTAGMKRYFEGKSWYQGLYEKVTLNTYEEQNCQLISDYAHSHGWYWKSGDNALNEADLYVEV